MYGSGVWFVLKSDYNVLIMLHVLVMDAYTKSIRMKPDPKDLVKKTQHEIGVLRQIAIRPWNNSTAAKSPASSMQTLRPPV